MDRLALDLNCWHYLNRDSIPIQNMDLVKEIKSNNKRFSMIPEVQLGKEIVFLEQDKMLLTH